MSTVATDGVTMAGDGLVSCGDKITSTDYVKVHRVGSREKSNLALVGIVGTVYDSEPFRGWWESGCDPEKKPELSDCFEALVLLENGEVFSYNHKCYRSPEPKRAATGSGMAVALGAMDAGASPEEAVRIAAGRDHCTGGVIRAVKFEEKFTRVGPGPGNPHWDPNHPSELDKDA